MFKYFEPNKIFYVTSRAPKYVFLLFTIFFSVGLTEAIILSPEDYKQSHSVRIMYVHVPSAWICLGIFSSMTFFSIIGYIFKIRNFFLISKSLAPSGFVFNIIALVTGSIWGKPTWGSWRVWDARLTSMIVLMFFYIAYIFVFKLVSDDSKSNKISSYIALIGAINIPIIKYSVDWFNTLHQPASIKIGSSSIHPSMLIPLLLMLLVFLAYCALIFLMKYRIEIIKIKAKNINRL